MVRCRTFLNFQAEQAAQANELSGLQKFGKILEGFGSGFTGRPSFSQRQAQLGRRHERADEIKLVVVVVWRQVCTE